MREGELQCYKEEATCPQTSGSRKVWTACTIVCSVSESFCSFRERESRKLGRVFSLLVWVVFWSSLEEDGELINHKPDIFFCPEYFNHFIKAHVPKILMWMKLQASREKCVKVWTPQQYTHPCKYMGLLIHCLFIAYARTHANSLMICMASPLLDLFRNAKISCENESLGDAWSCYIEAHA